MERFRAGFRQGWFFGRGVSVREGCVENRVRPRGEIQRRGGTRRNPRTRRTIEFSNAVSEGSPSPLLFSLASPDDHPPPQSSIFTPFLRAFSTRSLFQPPPPSRGLPWTSRGATNGGGITSNYKKLSADQIRYVGVLITTQKSGLDQSERASFHG